VTTGPPVANFTLSEDHADGGAVTVHAVGEIDLATSPQLRELLHRLVAAGSRRVVLDLSGTTFIDSSGLGVLVGVLRATRENGDDRSFLLSGFQDQVRKVFEITGLDQVFTIEG
jgi:anti-sigma B factor antagonist